jgi:hypothetical protein
MEARSSHSWRWQAKSGGVVPCQSTGARCKGFDFSLIDSRCPVDKLLPSTGVLIGALVRPNQLIRICVSIVSVSRNDTVFCLPDERGLVNSEAGRPCD